MVRNLLFLKLAALFGFVFLFSVTNGTPADAKNLVNCKWVSGTSVCHRFKESAYARAARGCPSPGALSQVTNRKVSCKYSIVGGKRLYCCRCAVRICQRYIISPRPKKPIFKNPPVFQQQKYKHRPSKKESWAAVQSINF